MVAKDEQQKPCIPPTRIYLSDFPAFPNETDDCGRFARAIAATPSGGELVVTAGHYRADSIQIQKNISLLFQGDAIIEATRPNRDILRIEGSREPENYVLAKPVKRGDRMLQLKQTPAYAPGDVVILTDDTCRVRDGQQDMNTEIHEIERVIPSPNLFTSLDRHRPYKGIAAGWQPHGEGSFSFDEREKCQRIEPTVGRGSGTCRAGLTQAVPVQEGEQYTFSVDLAIREAKGEFRGHCYLRWYTAKGELIEEESLAKRTSAGWATVEARNLSPPANATLCQFYIVAEGESEETRGVLFFRHWIVRRADTQLLLRDFVRLPKSISKCGINVYKILPLERVRVRRFRYRLKEGSTVGTGLVLRYVRGAILEEICGSRLAGTGVQIEKAMHVTVRGFRFSQPQCTGSGQGYGVQFFGGCSGIIVKDGFTFDLRHSVDLDSTYDAHIEHVFDYNSTGAAFVMSHNGCCSDIAFYRCQTLNTCGSGFVADSQGFADPRDCRFYNFQVVGCTAVIKNRSTAAVYWYSPCRGVVVRDCLLSYDDGQSCDSEALGNAGIRLYPVCTEARIDGCTIRGFRRGIALQMAGYLQMVNDSGKVTIRDTTIQHCQSSILCHQGERKRLAIFNLDNQSIRQQLFEINGEGSFSELILDGITLTQSPQCQLANRFPAFEAAEGERVKGSIRSLSCDQSLITITQHWKLSPTQLYFSLDDAILFLPGSGAVSSKQPLPDGLVEGQRLVLLTSQGVWTIYQGTNMVLKQRRVILNRKRRSLSLLWREGKWYEV